MDGFESLATHHFIINVLAALCCGAAIGIERQWRQRMAGLRTNALVSTGASLFVMLNVLIPLAGDNSRIAAQVVSGIGFLGAGVIMREGLTIRGLNTAATLWCSAAVGVLAGFGLWHQAVLGTVAILAINLILKAAAVQLNRLKTTTRSDTEVKYTLCITCSKDIETRLRAEILEIVSHSRSMVLNGVQSTDLSRDPGKVEIQAEIESSSGKQEKVLEKFVFLLRQQGGVISASWKSKAGMEETA